MTSVNGEKLRFILGIRSVVTIITFTVGCTVAIITYMSRIDHKLGELIEDRFGMARAAEVALREAIENPGFRKVDPRDPNNVIVVPTR